MKIINKVVDFNFNKFTIEFMKTQKEILQDLFNTFDSEFSKYGKVALMTGIPVKKLMALDKEGVELSAEDSKKLAETLEIFKQ